LKNSAQIVKTPLRATGGPNGKRRTDNADTR
jgi:hypothetical protein